MAWRRKRRWPDDWDPFDFFGGFSFIDEMMEKMMRDFEEMFREIREGELSGKPVVRGFSITIGPDGEPVIREFGTKSVVPEKGIEERRPLVDVIETDDEIQVIAEIPGVKKEDIELNATERTLEIRSEGEKRRYYEKVELPAEIDPDSVKATYNNGILEVVMKKKGSKGGRRIKVE
ncbi:MAG: hypothetical protein PWR13_501 [Archaeoglobi archaeon]|nr:hypothetical protein [Archaeoglobi archaeon]